MPALPKKPQGASHPMCRIIKRLLESMKQSKGEERQIMFCTVTLPPRLYKRNARNQFEYARQYVNTYYRLYCSSWIFVAELTEKGNVHLHGLVLLRPDHDQRIMLLGLINHMKDLGRFDIQPVRDLEKVEEYMVKDLYITEDIIELSPLFHQSTERFFNQPEGPIIESEHIDLDHSEVRIVNYGN